MGSNVVALTDDVKLPEAPVTGLVDMLRDLLAQAERGELAGLACTYVTSNQRLVCDWAHVGPVTGHLLVGGVARLLYRLNTAQD